jgi:hypothetical protein
MMIAGYYIGGFLFLVLFGLAIELYLHRKRFPTCYKCGTQMTEDTIVHINNAEDICVECYAKEIAPERYEMYFEDR